MRILGHLTFILLMMAGWVWLSCHNTGIVENILIVFGSLSLGVIAREHWPTGKGS